MSRNATPCRAYRIREWLKINCSHVAQGGISLLAGPSEGVQINVAPPSGPMSFPDPGPMQLIYPLRQGRQHVFQFFDRHYTPAIGMPSTSLSMVLTDQWVEGESPLVTMH